VTHALNLLSKSIEIGLPVGKEFDVWMNWQQQQQQMPLKILRGSLSLSLVPPYWQGDAANANAM
jgi:hypothetical protein